MDIKNLITKELVQSFVIRIWSLFAFSIIAYGCIKIHPGLVWIFLGMYILSFTINLEGFINVIISLPPIVNIPETKLNDIKADLKDILDINENEIEQLKNQNNDNIENNNKT